MAVLVASFLLSLGASLLLIRSGERHSHRSGDFDFSGPQKFHARAVPRIGGIAVFTAMVGGALVGVFAGALDPNVASRLLLCSVPTFAFGLAEDLTKGVSPRRRLFFTAVSAALATTLLDAVVRRTTIPGVDQLIAFYPFAVALTILAVTGVSNAVNIIDGFNGLASMCVTMMVAAIGYVAFQVGDTTVLMLSLLTVGAIAGFFVWNFPAGLLFLGDGGAYLLGFVLSELCVLLLTRNPGVSPLFALLLCSYPIFETVFTMYRRKFVRGVPTAAPDGIHLHTLIHRRLVRVSPDLARERRQTARNSMTSPYLWVLCGMSVIPAVLWWNNTAVLAACIVLFMVGYVLLYRSIVLFRAPRWLVLRRYAFERRSEAREEPYSGT
jgi:UDP-N-acetylmuramyl pentapeptide phosphotransferase/UDP-N-acetylglucosamine-1-phosphate transferase